MLLDPFVASIQVLPPEEQFDLPAALVERADGQCRQGHLVGEEDECLPGLRIFEADAARVAACAFVLQVIGKALLRVKATERDSLIAHQTGAAIDRGGIDATSIQIRLRPCDEESPRLMHDMQALEIDAGWPRAIGPIHHVALGQPLDCTRLDGEQIERMHVVQLAVRERLA